MHGEHLVVKICVKNFAVWCGKLQSDQESFNTANNKEKHCGGGIHDAEFFVVDSEHPRAPTSG